MFHNWSSDYERIIQANASLVDSVKRQGPQWKVTPKIHEFASEPISEASAFQPKVALSSSRLGTQAESTKQIKNQTTLYQMIINQARSRKSSNLSDIGTPNKLAIESLAEQLKHQQQKIDRFHGGSRSIIAHPSLPDAAPPKHTRSAKPTRPSPVISNKSKKKSSNLNARSTLV